MKRVLSLVLLCVLALSLTACGGKIRQIDNYSVEKQSDETWAIVYTDEEGVELIASLGAAAQPLVLEKGRFYFAEAGKLVSVDPEGEARLETPVEGMAEDAVITFTDEENFYLLGSEEDPTTCWRVSKTDSADNGLVTIPRKFRPTDYEELYAEIRAMVSAVDGEIRIKHGAALLDENGSLISLELQVLRYDGVTDDMNFWDNGVVTVRVGMDNIVANYKNSHVPLFLANETAQEELSLADFLTALEKVDKAEIATKTAEGKPTAYTVTYLIEGDEAYVAEHGAQLYDAAGSKVESIEGRRFIVAYAGEDGSNAHAVCVALEG